MKTKNIKKERWIIFNSKENQQYKVSKGAYNYYLKIITNLEDTNSFKATISYFSNIYNVKYKTICKWMRELEKVGLMKKV